MTKEQWENGSSTPRRMYGLAKSAVVEAAWAHNRDELDSFLGVLDESVDAMVDSTGLAEKIGVALGLLVISVIVILFLFLVYWIMSEVVHAL